ncbi:MAG: FdhF/YdeP family oxidoreductase [Cytophagales bacterium]|nr:FdhF/YdeP family oxidoreductase [Cytophagales bacterium]
MRNISATGQIKKETPKVKEPAEAAAGIGGITAAIHHLNKELGLPSALSTLSKMNQQGGFDCPGCAWPDPDDRSKLGEYCENGAKAIAEEATEHRVDEAFFAQHTVEEISQWDDYTIGKSGRITRPFVLKPNSIHYEPITWQSAFDLIGDQLHGLDHPDEAIFYTSGRSSNEAAFLYGLLARQLGTNNMPDCSNMCHESSGVALKATLGIGKGSVTLDDFPQAEVIIIMGQNPGTNHPRMLSALEKCKQNGGKIISINPLEEAGLVRFKNPQKMNGLIGNGTPLTDLHLPVKINEDVNLLHLLMKGLLDQETQQGDVLDQEFIKKKTTGFETFKTDLGKYDAEQLLGRTGLTQPQLDQAIDLLAKPKKIIVCWAMGLTQHENAVDNIKACVNLLLMKGSIGKAGAGTCPVRGHSNVQGDRTVGIMSKVSPALNEALQKEFQFQAPNNEGLDTVAAIQAMHKGKARVFISLGGNFGSAASDTYFTAQALQNCDLTVSISTKLNRTHLMAGKTSLILPTLGRSEKDQHETQPRFVTVENSMGRVHRSAGVREPASDQLMSEPEIVAGIGQAVFGDEGPVNWTELGHDYDLIREKIENVIAGFDDYQLKSAGKGFDLPNNARIADFTALPEGKAQFSVCEPSSISLQQDEFVLMTIRSHDQFNTTIYGMDDRYRGIYNARRIVMINPEDMQEKGLQQGELIDLTSHYEHVERRAESFMVFPYKIPRQNLAAYFPETNVLVPIDQFARGSRTPISKSIVVRIEKRNTP